jgi:hypothetical protein
MAVSNPTFTAQVDEWVRETEQRIEAVFKESTQRVASLAANGVPVDLGFARASVRASTESMPAINPAADNKANATVSMDFGTITLVIAGAQLGQTIYIGWTAAYILPLEYGHSKQAPAGFVRIAAAQWPRIVEEVTAELKGRARAQ